MSLLLRPVPFANLSSSSDMFSGRLTDNTVLIKHLPVLQYTTIAEIARRLYSFGCSLRDSDIEQQLPTQNQTLKHVKLFHYDQEENSTILRLEVRSNPERKKPLKENKSALYKHKGKFRWQGIKAEKYKLTGGDWTDIARHILIGNCGETAKFHVRYFEIAPGGCSSFERHKHEHVVICVRGKAKLLPERKVISLIFLIRFTYLQTHLIN